MTFARSCRDHWAVPQEVNGLAEALLCVQQDVRAVERFALP